MASKAAYGFYGGKQKLVRPNGPSATEICSDEAKFNCDPNRMLVGLSKLIFSAKKAGNLGTTKPAMRAGGAIHKTGHDALEKD